MHDQKRSNRTNQPVLGQQTEAGGPKESKGEKDKSSEAVATPMRDLECPSELPPIARDEWNRIVGELIALGVLSKFDRGPLAVYCGAFAIWTEAMDALQKFGTMIKAPSGYPVQSPYVAIVNRQADIMMKIAAEFGFIPAARSRNFSFPKSNSMLVIPNKLKDGLAEW
jgi:P27 family predicted phage terminase small subunit